MTVLALILTAIIAYLIGRAQGYGAAIRYVSSLFPDPNQFVEDQREQAPWQ